MGRWWRRRGDGRLLLGLRWGLGCWQWHRAGGRPEDDEVVGVDPAESTFCPDPVEDGDGVVGFVGHRSIVAMI